MDDAAVRLELSRSVIRGGARGGGGGEGGGGGDGGGGGGGVVGCGVVRCDEGVEDEGEVGQELRFLAAGEARRLADD
eukprot:7383096-Prymnesium_polylepis.1